MNTKSTFSLIFIASLSFGLLSSSNAAAAKPPSSKVSEGAAQKKAKTPAITHTVTMVVDGMSCGSCVQGLENAFKREDGVVSAKVNFKEKTASVTFDPDKTAAVAFVNLVNRSGEYTTSPRWKKLRAKARLDHRIDVRESGRVQHSLKGLKGIDDVALDGAALSIAFNPMVIDANKIVATLKGAGLDVTLPVAAGRSTPRG